MMVNGEENLIREKALYTFFVSIESAAHANSVLIENFPRKPIPQMSL